MKNTISIYCCCVMLICSELTSALGFSRTDIRNLRSQIANKDAETNSDLGMASPNWADQPPVPPMFKRACNGFPCMYSHLGTKAGRASLYKTLARFIDDCFQDSSCDPGRRKRFQSMGGIHKFLNTAVRDLPAADAGTS